MVKKLYWSTLTVLPNSSGIAILVIFCFSMVKVEYTYGSRCTLGQLKAMTTLAQAKSVFWITSNVAYFRTNKTYLSI
jgi:hypothetical protein